MAKVTIHGSGEVYESGVLTSLLNLLLSNRYPIETLCGGRAQCGKCVVRIVSGAGNLSPRGEREAVRLAALGAPAEARLACQTYTRGDIVIEVINRRPSPA
jgi:adenylate cyclase